MAEEAQKLLDELHFDVDAGEKVVNLPTAKQQLALIARTVSMEASLIIMDEPTSSLSISEIDNLFRVIKELKSRGISIIYISHFLEEIFKIADRVTVLRNGRLVGTKNAAETHIGDVISMMVGEGHTQDKKFYREHPSDEIHLKVENMSQVQGQVHDISFVLHKGEMNWCGECEACRMGMYNQCENLEEIGFTLDGAYAEYLVAKEKFCFDISALEHIYGSRSKALHIGALIEPLAVAYNGIFERGGGFRPGSDIVIFGAGPIGLSALSLAVAAGAGRVIVFEKSAARMKLAEKTGATYVCDIDGLLAEGLSPGQKVLELTGKKGAEVFIEATEFQRDNIPEIERALAVGAKVIQIGISSKTMEMDVERLQIAGASYHGTIGSAGHGIWQNVIALIAQGRVDPQIYMNPRIYTLEESLEAIEDAAKCGAGKNVVDPGLRA